MKEKPLAESGCVVVCCGKSCKKAGAGKLRKALEATAKDADAKVMVLKAGCLGRCGKAPVVAAWPEGACFMEATPDDAAEILTAAGVAIKQKKEKDKKEKKGKEEKCACKAREKKEVKTKAPKAPKVKKSPKAKEEKPETIVPPATAPMTPEAHGYAE
jgi:(2Fe-2S) ferredoxin